MHLSRVSTLLLLAATACVIGPYDLDEIDTLTSRSFSGYSQTASSSIRVLGFNRNTNQWTLLGTAVSSSTPAVPAGTWAGNPNLYSWSITLTLSNCLLNTTCSARFGTLGASTARLMFEEGGLSSTTRLVVFDDRWDACMGERTQAGDSFDQAAFKCRAPAYPELRLTAVEDWARLPISGPTGVIGAGHPDETRIVAGAVGSTLRFSRSMSRGSWSSWNTINGGPAAGLRTDSAPILLHHPAGWWPAVAEHELLIAGNDGLLYRAIYDEPANTFGALQAIPGLSGVSRRVSGIAGVEGLSLIAHGTTPGTVQVTALLNGAVFASQSFTGDEATLGDVPCCDGIMSVAAIRSGTQISLWRIGDGLHTSELLGSFDGGAIEDLSDVLLTSQATHLFAARMTPWGYGEIVHFQFPAVFTLAPFSVVTRVVGNYSPGGSSARLSAILEREPMVVWRDSGPGLKAARFMPAVGSGVWQNYTLGTTTTLSGRPALLRTRLDAPNVGPYDVPAYDRATEVAIMGSDARARFASSSKVMRRRDVERHFDVYSTSATSGCGSDSAVVDPVWYEDLAENDRQVLSAVGEYLWRLPVTLTDSLFRAAGKQLCVAGSVQPASAHRACELARTPLVLSSVDPWHPYTCPDGLYFSRELHSGFSSELGPLVARTMGFNNNGTPPSQANATASNISLAALQEGATLFGERIGQPCIPRSDGSCRGFSHSEHTGREEALSALLISYSSTGSLQQRIRSDLNAPVCDDLLARKYFWLKANVFNGYEYVDAYLTTAPPPALCP